ncbi:MAG: hypothetical protein Q8N39_12255 [Pelolinea sp.]|nr:hypothetical protein [Pelolinea sp.]
MLRYINQSPNNANHSVNSEISRIISAAVVNKRFCSALLSNPSTAISQGYCGEPFRLSMEQKDRISMINEHSLEGFAAQLAQI